MEDEIVTVIVPVRNRPSQLRNALDSLIKQTYQNFEVIVIDDASVIPVDTILHLYDGRFKYVRSDLNLGPAGARRIGFEIGEGSIFMNLDSDDTFLPHTISRAVYYLKKYSDVEGVSGFYDSDLGIFKKLMKFRHLHIRGGIKILSPESFKLGKFLPEIDMVGAVRRSVVQTWLNKSPEYFSNEGQLWLTHHSNNSHLMVQEIWGVVNLLGNDRISKSIHQSFVSDVRLFLNEHSNLFENEIHKPFEFMLLRMWSNLGTSNIEEREIIEELLRRRGRTRFSIITGVLKYKFKRKVPFWITFF